MESKEQKQPNYITSKDVDIAKKFGKIISEKANWNVSTKELMETFQYLMWYNSLPAKLTDNVMEVKAFVSEEELKSMQDKPKPKKTRKK